MGEALRSIQPENEHIVEVVVHVDETLGPERRKDLVAALEASADISVAEFCPLRYHLMLIQYDRDAISSKDVLARVMAENVHAQLIGPV